MRQAINFRYRVASGGVALLLLAIVLGALAGAPHARAAVSASVAELPQREFVPRQVIVKYHSRPERTVTVPRHLGVRGLVRRLRRDEAVQYAIPNRIATASAFLPNDTGRLNRNSQAPAKQPGGTPIAVGAPGGWMNRQWNLLPWGPVPEGMHSSPGGINAVEAWRNLRRVGRAGGRGITVAVIDTGVAYRNYRKRFRRNPDFNPRQFVPGYDFVRNNRLPLDRNGHGTHVAGTIAQATNNRYGLSGIAYRAKIMPIRVLDAHGNGASDRIAAGIRWAVDNGADVLNMSFNFACGDKVPNVAAAVRYAFRKGAVLIGSVGNAQTERCVSAPATFPQVIGVGGTTEGGCLGDYSLVGPGLDLVAPGGGRPQPGLDCEAAGVRPIYQVTFNKGPKQGFGFPSRYFGTSMAAAHVSGVAALVMASGVLGRKAKPRQVKRRLLLTARPPLTTVKTVGYGAGILDAAAATDRRVSARRR